MADENNHDHDHDHEAIEMAVDLQTQIFLELRRQNVEMLKIAAQVAGYGEGQNRSPAKADEVRPALDRIWSIYSEFYEWIDPEQAEEEE